MELIRLDTCMLPWPTSTLFNPSLLYLSVFSLYPLTLLLCDSHNVMTYTYRYRGDTDANGATGIVLNNNNSNRKMPARSEEASY